MNSLYGGTPYIIDCVPSHISLLTALQSLFAYAVMVGNLITPNALYSLSMVALTYLFILTK